MQLRISEAELGRRRAPVLAEMARHRVTTFVFWNATSGFYLSGA